MQEIKYAGVVLTLLMAGSVIAQQETAKTNAAAAVSCSPVSCSPISSEPVSGETAPVEVKVPSEEEIKAFVTECTTSAESATTESFQARFSVPRLKPDQKKKHADAKTAPFQLTLDLVKYQTVDNNKKFAGRITNGTASFVILDEEGKVVKAMSENLIKLCSSWGGSGGHLGEVTKAGKYKAIIWTKRPNNVTLGKVIELSLTTP